MSASKKTDPFHWNELHVQLKISMQQEIGIMREILANMHQEELALSSNDRTTWNLVLQERSSMVERLSTFRNARLDATHKLKEMALSDSKNQNISLEQILPTENEETCEILSLLDQILALMERMNLQNTRNQTLSDQNEHRLKLPISSHPQSFPQPQKPKRKASIATYDPKS